MPRVVGAEHHRALDPVDEPAEGVLEPVHVAPVPEVVDVDVRDDRRVQPEAEERAVALVGLDHQPLPGVEPRVRPDLVELAADEEAGVQVRGPQDERDHRRGRGLAVRPRDSEGTPGGDDAGERVGAREDRDAGPLGRDDLDVRPRHRGAEHDRVGVGRNVVRGLGHEALDAEQPEPLEARVLVQVRATHAVTELGEDRRVRAHARAPDAHDVDAAGLAQVEHATGLRRGHRLPPPPGPRAGRPRRVGPATVPRRTSTTAAPGRAAAHA